MQPLTETPTSLLHAMQVRIKSLQRVEYDVKRVYDYPAEQYHVERVGRLHQDYSATGNKALPRYRMDSTEGLDIFNGADRFYCNKKLKSLALYKSAPQSELLSGSGFQHSLYMLREGLGALGESSQVVRRFLPSPTKNLAVVELVLTKSALGAAGHIEPSPVDQTLELTLDRKSLLPTQLIQRFPKDGTITNTYSHYKLNPSAYKDSDYFYSSYLTTYALELPKKLKPLAVGALAPDWTLERADGAGTLSLQSLRGQYVVLDFFIVYCGPCIASVPKLNQWQKEYPKIAFVSVNIGDTRELVQGFIQRNKLQLPTVLGSPKLAKDYGFAAFPRLFVLSPDSRVLNTGFEGSEGVARLLRTI